MAGVVYFDPVAFKAKYPAFATVDDAQLQFFFELAEVVVNNKPGAFIVDLDRRTLLLYLLVAHVAQLSGAATPGGSGSTASQVGRISSATEGSVTAAFTMGAASGSAAYFLQTQYGALYWQITSVYRSARYVRPRRCC